MKNELRVRILDVGQGDAIVGLLPATARAFVVDVYRAEPVLRLLEREAIREVVLFLSHSDRDHTRGARDFLVGFPSEQVRAIYFNHDRPRPGSDSEYAKLLRDIGATSRTIYRATGRAPRGPLTTSLNEDRRYLEWFGPTVRVIVLHPAQHDLDSLVTQGKNEVSGVLLIEHRLKKGFRRTLLAADVQLTGISLMLDRLSSQPIAADVLKFPHHGAWPEDHPGIRFLDGVRPCTMADFLTAVSPRAVVVSAGFENAHGHVKQAVFDSLRALHQASGRLVEVRCTQFTPTCLGSRTLPPQINSACCAGDIEIRSGDSVGTDGLEISTVGALHFDRVRALLSVGGSPQCSFLPTVRALHGT